ncbi:hypothetical protein CDD83_6171 [Cordyceps sp. RAO-2017]|nr:hypothetical protein CDD83_6171 [Cordyceps sp. RAO-2017]
MPDLPALRRGCGAEPALLARCAVVVFSALRTASAHAVFTSWEAGRSWPFVPDWMQALLPPPATVDGPTAERTLNLIDVSAGETLRRFVDRVALDRRRARAHDHVPWDRVVDELREEGPVAEDASFRQSFVWDVSMGMALQRHPRPDDPAAPLLSPVARYDWADFGFCWNMFLASREVIVIVASWDTAQMDVDEVERHCDCMADVMRRLATEANWDRTIGDVFGARFDHGANAGARYWETPEAAFSV